MSSISVSTMRKQSGQELEQRQEHQPQPQEQEEQEQQQISQEANKSNHYTTAPPSTIIPKIVPEQHKSPNGRAVITPHDHDIKCGRGKGPRW